MAFSIAERQVKAARRPGFATAGATMTCLALALVATASVAGAVAQLKLARAERQTVDRQFRLDSAQTLAAATLLEGGHSGRRQWSLDVQGVRVSILAEEEAEKASWRIDSAESRRLADALGIASAADLARDLARMSEDQGASPFTLLNLRSDPAWRRCAMSLLSRYGRSTFVSLPDARPPESGALTWRVGQVWRIRTSDVDGWIDDRVIRFTGDAEAPLAVIDRRWSHDRRAIAPCQFPNR